MDRFATERKWGELGQDIFKRRPDDKEISSLNEAAVFKQLRLKYGKVLCYIIPLFLFGRMGIFCLIYII